MRTVFDASALLAVLFREPGAERCVQAIDEGLIGAVNLSEVLGRLTESGASPEQSGMALRRFDLEVVAFDADLAQATAELRPLTRSKGLSLGDRACLALARREGARVLTADRAWADLALDIEIEVIR